MNKMLSALIATCITLSSTPADARDTRLKMPIASAMSKAQSSGKLPQGVRFFFGSQKFASPSRSLGPVTTSRKTNFFNKSDSEGCEWTFLSAMMALGERARALGANAVVGIRSNYRNQEFSSETEYECGAGAVSGGVAFKAEIVTLP